MSEKLYNLTLVGPDVMSGHNPTEKPDFALPEPGPDNDYYYNLISAPGYQLGSYKNVYNFDAVINEILECEDWSTHLHPKKREYFNGTCMVHEIVGYENFLSIEHPDKNDIPKNVCVLIQKGMERGTKPPSLNDNLKYHYVLSDPEESKMGWWISDELKGLLEDLYDWKFFEDVNLEENISELGVVSQYVSGDWRGGIDKSLEDVHYHDLRLALNADFNLAGELEDDSRAQGERLDVLALFGYPFEPYPFVQIPSTATLSGDCDNGFGVEVFWNGVVPTVPGITVEAYNLYIQETPDSQRRLLWRDENIDSENHGEQWYSYSHELNGILTEVPNYPKYFITWEASNGEVSDFSLSQNLPAEFHTNGIPSCLDYSVNLEKEVGQCWTPHYGEVRLNWTIENPDSSQISSIFLSKNINGSITEYELENDVRTYTDTNVVWTTEEESDVEYTITVHFASNSNPDQVISEQWASLIHTIENCECDEQKVDCSDKCWVRKEVSSSCSDTDVESFNPQLLLWMDNYVEDPFSDSPSASFDVKYCISDKCKEGISNFDIRIKLPEGFSILDVDSEHGEVEFQPDFGLGATINEWVLSSDDYVWSPARPTHGTLLNVKIDKPLSKKRIEFVPENPNFIITVTEEDIDPANYTWESNAINPERVVKRWQSGPPLSVCTSEIDIGYGDYLIDLRSIDPRTIDVNYCLSRDDFDTFILVVLNTDFTTAVSSIDPLIGQANKFGWNITFRNIAPGMSVVIGHGDNKIDSYVGYETLLRMKLTESIIEQDSENCTCVFPFFLKLGDLWQTVKNISESYSNSGSSVTDLAAQTSYASTNSLMAVGADVVGIYSVSSSPIVSGLKNISDNIDPRFKEIVCCLHDAYVALLEKTNTPNASVTGQQITSVTLMVQLFMTMIGIFSTISIAKSKQINKQLDKIEELGETICDNYLLLEAVDGIDETEFDISIKYSIPLSNVSGIQFQINIPEGFVIDRAGLEGEAKNRKFIQILGNNGAYMCVYDYALSPEPSLGSSYLSSTGNTEPLLTSFKLKYIGEGTPPSLSEIKPLIGIFENQPSYIPAKMVTNQTRVNPSERWNGDWYNVDQMQIVDVRDFLVACILTTGGEGDLSVPDSVIVLPDDEKVSIKYFGGNSYDLSNLTYDTETYFGRDDEGFQQYMLDFFDANGDGVADVTDVVTIRNMFLVQGSTSISRKVSRTISNIVPTEVCTINRSLDFEFFVPDECSNFCVDSKCFSDIWISDIIQTGKDALLVEVSYASDCDEAPLSGVQFTVRGLYNQGIISCVPADGDTLIDANNWNYDIIASDRFSGVKNTVIAHAKTDNNYASSGSGILTYLLISKSSVYGLNSQEDAYKAFMHTNTTSLAAKPQTSAYAGTTDSSGYASLMATHKNSSEILAYKDFGLSITTKILTTNESPQTLSEDFDTSVETSVIKKLISYNVYEPTLDSNQDEEINIIDVQASYHYKESSSFPSLSGNDIVPRVCCPCEELESPKLSVGDFSSTDKSGFSFFTLDAASGWGKDRKYNVSAFNCGGKFEGAVIVAWTPVEGADYYIVYRRRKGQKNTALPVIGSKVGIIANAEQFASTHSKQVVRTPTQIDSTVWIDFPPADYDVCCDWCLDSETDSSCVTDRVSTEYEYYVVAHSDCGESSSNVAEAGIPCCNFVPKVEDQFIVVAGNAYEENAVSHAGTFKVKTKKPEDVWTFTNTESKLDLTREGGKFEVSSGAPYSVESEEYGVPNSFGYTYTPPVGFFGRDEIDFTAVVRNSKLPNWLDWCSASGKVNIFVVPVNIKIRIEPENCLDEKFKETVLLHWEVSENAEYYKIFRDGELIDSVYPEQVGLFTYRDEKISFEGCSEENKTITVSYCVSPVVVNPEGAEIYPTPQYTTVDIKCCERVDTPDFSVRVDRDICNEDGKSQSGIIRVFWQDDKEIETYEVYRKSPKDNDWVLIAVSRNADVDGVHRVYDKKIPSCAGCEKVEYQYSVVAVKLAGQSPLGEAYKSVILDCCNSKPKAYDSDYVVEGGEILIDKQLVASDRDSNIVSYSMVDDRTADGGSVYEFDSDNGTFSFAPRSLFEGSVSFTWKVTDLCGNEDSAIVTINIKNPEVCNEDDYVICNATIPYLTDQQDEPNARIKIDDLPQVPFFLNNKGVPSLRRRCGAYAATVSIDPSLFALPEDPCLFIELEPGDPLRMPEVDFSCHDEILFNNCKDGEIDGIPSVVIDCSNEISFNTCKGVFIDDVVISVVSCERNTEFSNCTETGSNIEVDVTCESEIRFSEKKEE